MPRTNAARPARGPDERLGCLDVVRGWRVSSVFAHFERPHQLVRPAKQRKRNFEALPRVHVCVVLDVGLNVNEPVLDDDPRVSTARFQRFAQGTPPRVSARRTACTSASLEGVTDGLCTRAT